MIPFQKSPLESGVTLRTSGTLNAQEGFFSENAREIQVSGHSDVLVCGGGPAGIAAALGAARAGANVRLIELAGCLGGVWTAGLLTCILDGENKSGIMQELLEDFGGHVYDPEQAKQVLEDKLTTAGVELRYHTMVTGAVCEGRRLKTVLTESKSGREAWTADCFVDCTGDGDLAAQAGCGFEVGKDESCTCQPMSMMALLTGLSPETYQEFKDRKHFLAFMKGLDIEPSYRSPTLRHIRGPIYSIMTNHEYGVSAFDATAVTEATVRARREINEIVQALRKAGHGFEDLMVVATAEQIGIREGRRIHGRYAVNREDIMTGLRRDDAVCRVAYPVDIHGLKKEDPAYSLADGGERSKAYDIPYPALVAADVDGLLMAGRNISGDFVAHSSYRVTGNSVPMGEAAGKAAALAAKTGRLPHELSWGEIMAG